MSEGTGLVARRRVLDAIRAQPGIEQTGLTQATGFHRRYLREILADLRDDGLVEIHQDTGDLRRRVYYPAEVKVNG